MKNFELLLFLSLLTAELKLSCNEKFGTFSDTLGQKEFLIRCKKLDRGLQKRLTRLKEARWKHEDFEGRDAIERKRHLEKLYNLYFSKKNNNGNNGNEKPFGSLTFKERYWLSIGKGKKNKYMSPKAPCFEVNKDNNVNNVNGEVATTERLPQKKPENKHQGGVKRRTLFKVKNSKSEFKVENSNLKLVDYSSSDESDKN